ncbi:MAG: hypothetical protein Q9174_001979 [Haloplaca sp. 1 TL-2023]
MSPEKKDPHASTTPHEEEGEGGEKVRCYVCSTDLTPSKKKKGKGKEENGGKEKGPGRGMVELRSEGTGFAGGGKNIASRSGVAFQIFEPRAGDDIDIDNNTDAATDDGAYQEEEE